MKEFLEMLKQRVADNPPNYGDADSVLGLLYECFNENNPYDNEQIKADFEELYRFVNEMEFDRLGVFTYSQEEDTVAAEMPDQIDEDVKAFRRDELMELQQEIAFEKAEDMIGRTLTVMVEGKVADEDVYVTRTYRDAPNVDGYLFLNTTANLMTGDFVNVLVTDCNEYDLIGEIAH